MTTPLKKIRIRCFILCFSAGIMHTYANCRVHDFRQECEAQKECVWDSRGCNVGSALEAVDKDGKVIHRSTVEKHPLETSF
jgi:hypothetical protein